MRGVGETETLDGRRFIPSDPKPAKFKCPSREDLRLPGVLYPVAINNTPNTNQSQFLITLGASRPSDGLDNYFNDPKDIPIPFGRVIQDSSGVLDKLNSAYCDSGGRPYQDVRILHTVVVYDPWHGLEEEEEEEEEKEGKKECRRRRDELRSSGGWIGEIEGFKSWLSSRGSQSPVYEGGRHPS